MSEPVTEIALADLIEGLHRQFNRAAYLDPVLNGLPEKLEGVPVGPERDAIVNGAYAGHGHDWLLGQRMILDLLEMAAQRLARGEETLEECFLLGRAPYFEDSERWVAERDAKRVASVV